MGGLRNKLPDFFKESPSPLKRIAYMYQKPGKSACSNSEYLMAQSSVRLSDFKARKGCGG